MCAKAFAYWQYLCWQVCASEHISPPTTHLQKKTRQFMGRTTQQKKLNGTIKQICCTNKCDIIICFLILSMFNERDALQNKQTYFYYVYIFLSIIRVVGASTNSNRTYTYARIYMHTFHGDGKKIGNILSGKNVSCCETRFNFTATTLGASLFLAQ